MPEIKKVFAKGKMNQDLDERLVPNGEYREAQNIQVSSSEDSDVGAVENILGNKLAYNEIRRNGVAYTDVGDTVIGAYVDPSNDRIFWFTTDFDSLTERATSSNDMAIIMKEGNNNPIVLVTGHFLNFSKSYKITGINTLEGDYLFWTDNYNQPRGIDISIVDDDFDYYDCEEKISVAKIAPYQEPLLASTNIVASGTGLSLGDGTTLVRDADVKSDFMQDKFIRFAYRYKYKDGQYSIISPFTQSVFKPLNNGVIAYNANQRNTTNADEGTGYSSGTNAEPKVATSVEDVYEKTTMPIMQNAWNKVTMRIPVPNVDEFQGGADPGSTYSNPFKIDSIEILLKESDGLSIKLVDTIDLDDTTITYSSYSRTVESETVVANGDNDDTTLLVDTAPSKIATGWVIENYGTTILGSTGRLHVTGVNGTTITLNGAIDVDDDDSLIFKKLYYRQAVTYTYTSDKPYKVLPSRQLIRVSDKIPVKAKAQEIVSNRLIYGNLTQNYALPLDSSNRKGIDYTVSSAIKGDNEYSLTSGLFQHHDKIYPFHSVKQRRTYQVGIVLSDIYGRKSPVILSTNTASDASDTTTVSAVTTDFANPYLYDSDSSGSGDTYSWTSNLEAVGKVLTISFEDSRVVEDSKLYNKDTNPNGWYSWRLVVKQQEQDYYNIYVSHPINSWKNDGNTRTQISGGSAYQTINGVIDTTSGGRTWVTLYGDNINKVPRSVRESDFTKDGIAGSEVKLYPKIVNDNSTAARSRMGNANQEYIDVLSIGNAVEQGLFSDNSHLGGSTELANKQYTYLFVLGKDRNPLVAELPNLKTETVACTKQDAAIATANNEALDMPFGYPTLQSPGLTVFETKPVESDLDIFYETSTGGLLQDLNEQVIVGGAGPEDIAISADTFPESSANATAIGNLSATAVGGSSIASFSLLNTKDEGGVSRPGWFVVVNDSGWKVKTNTTFAFNNLSAKDTFILTIKCVQANGAFTTADIEVRVTNSIPTINSGTGSIPTGVTSQGVVIGSVQAFNGSANVTLKQKFLTPGNVTEPTGGATISELELTQPSNGTIQVQTSAAYSESDLFSGATSKIVNLSVTDNGGSVPAILSSFTINLNSPLGMAAWFHVTDACSFYALDMSTTYYFVQGTGTYMPTANNLFDGNKVYTNSGLTTLLGSGQIVIENSGGAALRYTLLNGVVQSSVPVYC